MTPVTEWQVWWSKEIADLALSDPVAALEVIGLPARHLDGTYPLCGLRPAGDSRAGPPRRHV